MNDASSDSQNNININDNSQNNNNINDNSNVNDNANNVLVHNLKNMNLELDNGNDNDSQRIPNRHNDNRCDNNGNRLSRDSAQSVSRDVVLQKYEKVAELLMTAGSYLHAIEMTWHAIDVETRSLAR